MKLEKSKKCNLLGILLLIIFTNSSIFSQSIWEKGNYKITLNDNEISLFVNETVITQISSFAFNFVKPYKTVVEEVFCDSLKLNLLFDKNDGFNNNFPKSVSLVISQFNNSFHFRASNPIFKHITIELKDKNEHYYGLIEKLYPNNSHNPDLRGNVVNVEVYSYGDKDYAENYASAYSAFFISSNGYGSFFDTFAKGKYKLGIESKTEIYHQTDNLNWYVFYGPSGDKIHKEYYHVIGKPKFIPIWACGPIFWRDYNKGGSKEILDDISKYSNLQIPLTACFVDRPYSNGGHEWSKMDFSENFKNPEIWINEINQKYGLEFMTWVGSLTFTDKEFPGLLPGYKSYIDLTNPDALDEFESRLNKHQYSIGVRGHKMDRADEGFPSTALWNNEISESESRNKYVYLYSKVIDSYLSKAHGKNQFNFARAAFHRTQPYLSAIWGGDNRSNWLGMSGNMANAIRSSFQGFPIWGNDTGGYLGEGRIDEHLYLRWLQFSAWNGLFEVKIDGASGSGDDRPPWKYSEKLQEVYKNVSDTRMNLLPYIYSHANTSYKNGVMMKPLQYSFPNDKNVVNIWDEYMFGNTFLVAPLFSDNNEREIYLPEGKWYEFYDQQNEYVGPTTITTSVSLKNIPVFVKENSIYITGNIYDGNSKLWKAENSEKENISINIFPGSLNSEFIFDYIDFFDNDNEKEIKVIHQKNKIIITSPPLSTSGKVNVRKIKKYLSASLNENNINFEINDESKSIEFEFEKGKPFEILIKY